MNRISWGWWIAGGAAVCLAAALILFTDDLRGYLLEDDGDAIIAAEDEQPSASAPSRFDEYVNAYIEQNARKVDTHLIGREIDSRTAGGPIAEQDATSPVSDADMKPNFGEGLEPFGVLPADIQQGAALLEWIKSVEEQFEIGLYSEAIAINETQLAQLKDWAYQAFDRGYIDKRMEDAYRKVAGGYRLTDPTKVSFLNPMSIQSVRQVSTEEQPDGRVMLIADIIMQVDAPVIFIYELNRTEDRWVIANAARLIGKIQ